ncbi:MAG TPA: phosphoribosylamine--glycine ligase [Candidatus Limnocylindrales bacterium]|nr:phosphoribosylamine--glycine ligase [Candidatus Limnocylindrales bacterium]
MDVLVIGSGGREHALAWRLARDEGVRRVRVAPGNGGTAAVGESVGDLDARDVTAVARHAARERYGLVVIGPEAPLASGLADELSSTRIPTFGPTRAAARLESSKMFAKEQMRRAGVPTGSAESFTDPDAALAHLRTVDRPPVVKADWLAAGKGVSVPDSLEEAEAAVRELFASVAPGARIVLEERLTGTEVSAFALVSDEAVVPLAAACDYKRLGDGDTGPNTGGMGAYAPVPWFGRAELEQVAADVFEPIAWRMARDGFPYRGVLYAGLMLTDDGPMVLEFNARFGDPEAQVLLPMVDGDLAAALLGCATADRGLMEGSVALRPGAAVGVVVAADGYPNAPVVGRIVEGAEPSTPADDGDLLCFHAGTSRLPDGRYETTGGRVLTMVGRGATMKEARDAAYRGVADVSLDGGQYRGDIAARELGAGDGAQLGHEAG